MVMRQVEQLERYIKEASGRKAPVRAKVPTQPSVSRKGKDAKLPLPPPPIMKVRQLPAKPKDWAALKAAEGILQDWIAAINKREADKTQEYIQVANIRRTKLLLERLLRIL